MPSISIKQRETLKLIGIAIVALVGILWWGGIRPLKAQLHATSLELTDVAGQVRNARRTLIMTESIDTRLILARNELDQQEENMAQGDTYRWIINALLAFQSAHVIEFSTFDQPTLGEWRIPPQVPYSVATFPVSGFATYRDFGRFLANFENRYPEARLLNLELERASENKEDEERSGKLLFHLKFSLPVKPPSARF